MLISHDYPQFMSKPAYFVVTGKQEGIIYKAHKGKVEQAEYFKVKNPQYSDNEGFFQTSGHGNVFNSGNVREDKQGIKKHVIKEFLNELRDALDQTIKAENDYFLYVFTPEYMKERLNTAFSNEEKEHLVESFYGNYTSTSEKDILKMVAESQEDQVVTPESEEAYKIRHKTNSR